MGWELAVVTMAVLGGVNILGGSGSMPGVIIAAFLMGLVTFGLSLLNVPGIVMSVIIGAMLIVVISPADYYPADDAAKTMLISPSPWPPPLRERVGVRGNGFPKINIKENYHEFYVGTT